jgi:hypothetical protein
MQLGLLPRHLPRLSPRLRLRFTYAPAYYPLLGLMLPAGLLLPPAAVLSGLPWRNVDYFDFLPHSWALPVWLLASTLLLRHRRLLRPPTAPLVSWECWLFTPARRPFVIRGLIDAVRLRVRPRPITFKVTPKGAEGPRPLLARLILPFAAIAAALSAVALNGELAAPSVGYVFLCLAGATVYATVAVAVPVLHLRETARATGLPVTAVLHTVRLSPAVGLLAALPVATASPSSRRTPPPS